MHESPDTEAPHCAVCGTKLAQPLGPGRPAKYCDAICRRVAEARIRRITRQLDAIEARISGINVDGEYLAPRERKRLISSLSKERERLEGQFRALLEESK